MRLVSKMFRSRFLRAQDVEGEALFTIAAVNPEVFRKADGSTEKKLVIEFQETTQRLATNLTNRNALVEMLGDDIDEWPGHALVLYSLAVQGPGGMTHGIRIKPEPQRRVTRKDVWPEQRERFKPLAGTGRAPAHAPVEPTTAPDDGDEDEGEGEGEAY